MPAFIALVLAVAVYELGVAYLPLYLDSPGRRRRQELRAMRARRVHGIRVHQPIPRQALTADGYTVEAAAQAARRDRDDLIASLGQIGQPAA